MSLVHLIVGQLRERHKVSEGIEVSKVGITQGREVELSSTMKWMCTSH